MLKKFKTFSLLAGGRYSNVVVNLSLTVVNANFSSIFC